jgi:hypothetical protein
MENHPTLIDLAIRTWKTGFHDKKAGGDAEASSLFSCSMTSFSYLFYAFAVRKCVQG